MFIVSLALMFGGLIFYLVTFNLSLKAFRKVVDFEFQNHNDFWVADGRPIGGKVTRSNLTFVGSDFATISRWIRWTISRPSWVSPESITDKLRVSMIRWLLLSLIGFLVFAAGIISIILSFNS
jgi:hypothetical protein